MILPLTFVLNEITVSNLKYWRIKSGSNLIGSQVDDIPTEQSLEILKTKLSEIGSGAVTITASPASPEQTNGSKYAKSWRKFETEIKPMNTTSYHTPQYENLQHELLKRQNEYFDLFKKNLELQTKLERAEDRIIELTEKCKGLEDELNEADNEQNINGVVDKISGIMDKAAPFIVLGQTLIQSFNNKPQQPQAINGLPADELWKQFCAIEPDAGKLVEAVMKLKNNDPGQYNLVKSMLIK